MMVSYLSCGVSLLMATAVTTSIVQQVQSYVIGDSPNNNNNGILARFSDVQCELLMTVGRTPNTNMPPAWGASGAKLGLPLKLKFSSESCDKSYYDTMETLLLGGPNSSPPSSSILAVQPLNEPSFTSMKGVETVKVSPGAFSCHVQRPETQQYSFRFFLDFPEGATRNDVVLPAERIYFMTACWNENGNNMIEKAKNWKEDLAQELEKTNDEIKRMKNFPIGLEKTLGLRQYFQLLEHSRKLSVQLDMLEETFPPSNRLFEAPNDIVFLREGVIAVKRYEGNKEQYHWVGTFNFRKMVDGSGEV